MKKLNGKTRHIARILELTPITPKIMKTFINNELVAHRKMTFNA
jgi:hypothetical protein